MYIFEQLTKKTHLPCDRNMTQTSVAPHPLCPWAVTMLNSDTTKCDNTCIKSCLRAFLKKLLSFVKSTYRSRSSTEHQRRSRVRCHYHGWKNTSQRCCVLCKEHCKPSVTGASSDGEGAIFKHIYKILIFLPQNVFK